MAKTEDAGYQEFEITIDLYRKHSLKETLDIGEGTRPVEIIQSFVDDWQQLKKLDPSVKLTAADFERLGRAIKIIGQTIDYEKRHTERGANFLCSQFDGMDDEDDNDEGGTGNEDSAE